MSDKPSDGGPAFPSGDGPQSGGSYHENGMSLRDWFAGRAIGSALAGVEWQHGDISDERLRSAAIDAYRIADAMLIMRGRNGKS